jgi:protein-S-isoprenylcysteine O-methyltransferase Ste14
METKSEMTKSERRKLLRTVLTRFSMLPVFLGLFVLLPAGTFDFWQFYAYLAVTVVPMVFVMIYFLREDPEFLVRRMRAREKEKQQKNFQILSSVTFLSAYFIPGLDRRFGWSDIPLHTVLLADAIILLGYLLVVLVFNQNRYASRIVEVEEDQKLITTGLYSVVRHPMYLGVLLMFIPVPPALGSLWGLVPAVLFPIVLVIRILNEERVLQEGLPGYEEYCRKTRYRLIPFVW